MRRMRRTRRRKRKEIGRQRCKQVQSFFEGPRRVFSQLPMVPGISHLASVIT